MNIPIKHIPYLLIGLLITLVLAFQGILPAISHYSNIPKSDLVTLPSQSSQPLNGAFVRDSLLHLKKETDSLKETITSLNYRDNQLRAAWLIRKKQLFIRIQQIKALSPDSQLLVFQTKTVPAERPVHTANDHPVIAASPDSTSDSPVVSIPLSRIRNANEKLGRLEVSDSLTEMLETILANQDCLILTYHEVVLRFETQNSLLNLQTETLQQALLQKDCELKDLKTKRRIELTGASLLLILAILF